MPSMECPDCCSCLPSLCVYPEMPKAKSGPQDTPNLSTGEAQELLSHLDNVRSLLHNYLHRTQGEETETRRKSWWGRHCWPDKRRVLYRFVTIITLLFQLLNLVILTIIDTWPRHDAREHDFLVASATTMIVIQLVNLVLIILASGRLMKQIYRHSVNGLFLAQSYIATILLFAGLYTLTFRLQKQSWKFVSEELDEDPVQGFILYAKFLFYSISTATLCGSDNVLPVEWYNCIFAGIQMLLSFCYFASILGSAITFTNDSVRAPPPPRQGQMSRTFSGSVQQQVHEGGGDDEDEQQQHQQQQQQQQQRQQEVFSTGARQPLLTMRAKRHNGKDSEVVLGSYGRETSTPNAHTAVRFDTPFRQVVAMSDYCDVTDTQPTATSATVVIETEAQDALASLIPISPCHSSFYAMAPSVGSGSLADQDNDVSQIRRSCVDRTADTLTSSTTTTTRSATATIHNANCSNNRNGQRNGTGGDVTLLVA